MASFNKAILMGNLTRDPELRHTPSGAAVCDASIAVNRSWTSKEGEKKDEVSFFDLVIWNKGAETFAQYMKKGRSVLVEGELRQERWEQDGQKRSRVRIHVARFQFIGGTKQEGAAPAEEPLPQPDPDVAF